MSSSQTPRILQQPPSPDSDAPQERTGSNDSASAPEGKEGDREMGEGSYEGTREYNKRTQDYLKSHDVQKDAEAAKPGSEEEARDLQRAEEEGKSHSKGEH